MIIHQVNNIRQNKIQNGLFLFLKIIFIFLLLLSCNQTFALCTTFPWDTSPAADCPDWDWYSNYWEMVYWTSPRIPNDKVDVIDLLSPTWVTSDTLTVDIPNNLMNVDIENSWFMAFSTWWFLNFLDSWVPTETWTWINNNQTWSRIAWFTWWVLRLIDYSSSWSLVWTGTYTWNITPQWPNRLSVTINTDTDNRYVFFKIIDYEIWDPTKKYTRYIYLWLASVDVTKPVCSIITSWIDHEQRTWTWIENVWWDVSWNTWTILSMLWTWTDISIYTWSTIHHTYTWDLVRTFTWYVPWDTSKWIKLNATYKDNLGWIHYSKYSILESTDWAIYDQYLLNQVATSTLWTIPSIKIFNYSNTICTLSSSETCTNQNDKYNNKKVYLKVWDRAWNTNICSSLISKVDNNYPSIIVNSVKDYLLNDFTFFWDWYIKTNQWYSLNIDLDDFRVNYQNILWITNFENPSEWVSWIKPSDFSLDKIFYCWKKLDDCKNEIISLAENNDPLLDNYIYSSTWGTSSWVFASWYWDISSPTWIFFRKDAYFTNTWIVISSTWISISSESWSTIREILMSNSWTYLSTSTWLIQINTDSIWINNLNGTWFVNTEYDPLTPKFLSWANINWIAALKVYSLAYEDWWVSPGDFFHIAFNFKDKAWNIVPTLRQWLTIVWQLLAKVLWNVQINQNSFIDDPNVQVFSQPSSIKEVLALMKNNIRNELTNSSVASSWILVNSLDDLSWFKFNYWDEEIYVVRASDIVFWKWTNWTLNLTSSWKNITIVSYWWNIVINSKYLYSENDLTLVAFIDPNLQETRVVESQWNILINPNTLAIKSFLISEWSLLSYANINDWSESKIEILLNFNSRKTLFRNQLLIDWSITSYNTIWWYINKECPSAIYWLDNTCDISKFDVDNVTTLSLAYDLHYLRMFTWWTGNIVNLSDIRILNENDIWSWHTAIRSTQVFNWIRSSVWWVSFDEIGDWTILESTPLIKWINDWTITDAPEIFEDIAKNLSTLVVYPIIIKSEVPDSDIKIFNGN